MLEASADLGANPKQTFMRITLPITFPGIFSAIILTFIPSLGIYTVTDMLGGGKIYLIGNAIEQAFNSGYADVHAGSGLSMSLMVLILISIVVYRVFDKGKESESIW